MRWKNLNLLKHKSCQRSSTLDHLTICGSTFKLRFFFYSCLLTHFQLIFHLYSPWKHQKTTGFLMFQRGIEVEHWFFTEAFHCNLGFGFVSAPFENFDKNFKRISVCNKYLQNKGNLNAWSTISRIVSNSTCIVMLNEGLFTFFTNTCFLIKSDLLSKRWLQ